MTNTDYLKARLDLLKIYISAAFGVLLVTLAYMAQNLIGNYSLIELSFKSISLLSLLVVLAIVLIKLEKSYIYYASQLIEPPFNK